MDQFTTDGIDYGVEEPLKNRSKPPLLIYNQNDPEPIHHDGSYGEDSDYSSRVMNSGYFQNKLEQLSGVNSGPSSSLLGDIVNFIKNNIGLEGIILIIFFVILLMNIPYGQLIPW